MKYFIQAVLVATLCACGAPDEMGGSSAPSVSSQATAAASSLNDSADIARARASIIADIQAQRHDSAAKLGERAEFVLALDSLIAKLRSTPAQSSDELKELVIGEMLNLAEKQAVSALSSLKASIPARKNPEPKAGEKVDAVGLDGLCSNDLVVDMGYFRAQTIEFTLKLIGLARSRRNSRSLETSQAANALVNRCDLLVDRYGSTGVCRVKSDGLQKYDLTAFRAGCQELRKSYQALL